MPNLFGTVAIISHAMAIDIHDDLINAWNAIVQSPNHPARDQMVTFFERMPEALTVRWPDHYLSRHWRDVLEEEEHPRHGEAAEVLDSFVRGITSRWQQRPDREIEDRLPAWMSWMPSVSGEWLRSSWVKKPAAARVAAWRAACATSNSGIPGSATSRERFHAATATCPVFLRRSIS